MFVTATPSTPVTTTTTTTVTTTTTTSSLPLSLVMGSHSDIQIKDCTLGDTVCAQEWIARELGRIQQNTKPRHCHDYEALLQVIDDMGRFLKVPGGTAAAVSPASVAVVPQQQTHILRLVDLEHALVRIVWYSQRYDANHHHSHPSKLVLVLDDMVSRRQLDGGKIKDTASAQQQLFSTLFGQVQLTSHLVESWKMICQWAKQLPCTRDWHVWMGYGLDTYVKAKQRCHLRVDAGTNVTTARVANDPLLTLSSPSPDSSTSSSSSSVTSRDHQMMLEQL